jgi:hypothetical protein
MLDIAHAFDRTRVRVEEADMGVGTTGPQGRCVVEDVEDGEVAGPRGGGVAGQGVRTRPAGTRPARPADVWGPVRPAGRRGPAVLPAVRPRVAGGGAGSVGGVGGAAGAAVPPVAVPPAVARRRRVVAAAVLGVVLGVLLGALVALVSPVGGVAAPVPADTTVAVVGAGESLSDVAARVAPGADAGAVVLRIRELNGLEGSAVAPGRPLVVPAPAVAG